MATYKVKMTIAAITSNESEVIACHTILFCHGVGYKIASKMSTRFAGCNEKKGCKQTIPRSPILLLVVVVLVIG